MKRTKKKESPMSEKAFLKYIQEAFEHDDILKLHRRNVGATEIGKHWVRFGEPGQADLFGTIAEWTCPYCRRQREGVSVEIEVKGIDKNGKRGKQSPAQKKRQAEVERNNGIYLLLFPAENDPIGLRARIWRLIDRKMCPACHTRTEPMECFGGYGK
jgi:hypothetical protein